MHIICLNFPHFVLQLEELAALPAQALSHVHILIHWANSLDNIIFSVDLTPTAKQKPPLSPPVLPGHQDLSPSPSMQRNSSARGQVNQLVGSCVERKAKNSHNQAQKLVFKRFSAQTSPEQVCLLRAKHEQQAGALQIRLPREQATDNLATR